MNTYRATNTLNGKFYIGSTKDFEYRKAQHLNSKADYPFQSDLRKNPEAFVWEIYTDDLDTNEHEVRLLKEFFFDPRCYNLNPSAERPPSPKGKIRWKNELTQKEKRCFEKPKGKGWEKGVLQKTRKKISVANSGEKHPMYGRTGENHPQYGRTGALNPVSKAVIAIQPDGTELYFGSTRETSRELGINNGHLSGEYLKTGKVLKKGKFEGWRFVYENS